MGLLSRLVRRFGPRAPLDEALREAVGHAMDTVDPLLATASDCERRLAPAAGRALEYCAGLVAGIPGPVDVGPRAFAADPLVHALFGGPDGIFEMLGKSRELKAFLAGSPSGGEEFYALLGVRRREKVVSGMALQGEVVRSDVPQRLLYFADHTLGEIGDRHETTRRRLQAAAFDSLVQSYAETVAGLRRERDASRTAMAMARSAADAERQALEGRQRRAIAALEPESLLRGLVQWLESPQERLYLTPVEVTVDRMGVIAPHGDAAGDGSTLRFPELAGRDRRRWLVMVARIRREDAREALARQEQAHRYLVI